MSYETVIFDLDGTLLDTLTDLRTATNRALVHFGWGRRTQEEVRKFVGNGIRRLMAQAVPGGEQNEYFEDALAAFHKEYAACQMDHTKPYDGIPELIETLEQNGVRMAIVSNKPDYAVKDLNDKFFHFPIACGDKEGQNRKPAPDVVFEAIKQLDADPKTTVYVGDSEVDVATAANADIPCIAVSWGFRDIDVLKAAGAETIVDTPEELLSLI